MEAQRRARVHHQRPLLISDVRFLEEAHQGRVVADDGVVAVEGIGRDGNGEFDEEGVAGPDGEITGSQEQADSGQGRRGEKNENDAGEAHRDPWGQGSTPSLRRAGRPWIWVCRALRWRPRCIWESSCLGWSKTPGSLLFETAGREARFPPAHIGFAVGEDTPRK